MITDTELKIKGLTVLTECLGPVEAEKFISLLLREPFDYTKWQRRLWQREKVERLSRNAMKYRRHTEGQKFDAALPRRRKRQG